MSHSCTLQDRGKVNSRAVATIGSTRNTEPAPVVVRVGAAPAPAGDAAEADDAPAADPRVKEIRSPMVGTFYRRPAPDQDPYVDVGASVSEDTVVCIEAMKVNNEIKAELDGDIVEILVEDGHPVEFDQPLFRVRT